jgi:rhodanese-related sulfurtransferase
MLNRREAMAKGAKLLGMLATAVMHEMGYLSVRSIAGGFDAWVASGRPVAKPAQPSFD